MEFIGREREIDLLLEWERRDADAPWWIVVGDPGAGKTALGAAVVEELRRRGRFVAALYAPDPSSHPPLWPVGRLTGQLLDGIPELRQNEILEDLPHGARRALERLTGRSNQEGQESPRAWFSLYEAVLHVVRSAAYELRPMVFVDDAHRLDESSARIMGELSRELVYSPLGIIATVREPLPPAVVQFAAGPRTRRLDLPPLSSAEVTRIAYALGIEEAEEVVDEVIDASGGNALFVTELLYRYRTTKRPIDEMAPALGSLLPRYVQGLSRDAGRLIRLAAVLGNEFGRRELIAASDEPDTAVIEALTDAEQTGVIVGHAATEALSFKHQVIHSMVLAAMSDAERAGESERAARNLELRYGSDSHRFAERLSSLYLRGFSEEAVARGLSYAAIATRRAVDALAFEDAERTSNDALSRPEISAERAVEFRFLRGVARYKLGKRHHALRDLSAAFEAYAERGAVERLVAILSVITHVEVGDVEILRMAERILEFVPADEPEGIVADCYRAFTLHLGLGRYEEGIGALEDVLRRAIATGIPALVAVVHAVLAQRLPVHRRFDEAAEHIRVATELVSNAEKIPAMPDPRPYVEYARSQMLLRSGKLAGARRCHEAAVEICRESSDDSLLGPALQMGGRASLREGELAMARALGARAVKYSRHTTGAYLSLVASCYHSGDTEAGDGHLRDLLETVRALPIGRGTSHTTFASLVALRLWTTESLEFVDEARRVSIEITERARAHPHLLVRAGFALAEIAYGDRMAGRSVSRREVDAAGAALCVCDRYLVLHEHYVSLGRALVSACRGVEEDARAHLERARSEAVRYVDRPAEAWILATIGQLAVDPRDAYGIHHNAYRIASALGMEPLAAKLGGRLLLTPREREILGHIARGLQAKEIAAELDIRVSTVHNHIQQILRKTGSGNRIEAIRWAQEIGILGA